MAAKFFSNNIPLKPKSFAEFAQETVAKMRKEASAQSGQVKTASVEGEEKTAGKKEIPPFIQEKIDAKNGDKKEDKKDGKEEKEASTKVAKKEKEEAEKSGQLDPEPLHQDGESNKGSDLTGKNKKTEAAAKVASGKNEDEKAKSSGQLDVEPLHQKGESVKPSTVTDGNKKEWDAKGGKSEKSEKKEEKEASTTSIVKLAKLDSKTREFLKTYWSNLYPADYVESMLAEK